MATRRKQARFDDPGAYKGSQAVKMPMFNTIVLCFCNRVCYNQSHSIEAIIGGELEVRGPKLLGDKNRGKNYQD